MSRSVPEQWEQLHRCSACRNPGTAPPGSGETEAQAGGVHPAARGVLWALTHGAVPWVGVTVQDLGDASMPQ